MTVGEAVMATPKVNISLVDPHREELDMIFNFSHTDSDNFLGVKYLYRKFKLTRFKKRLNKQQVSLKGKGWNSLFIENHDQRRSVGRFGTVEGNILSSEALATSYFLLQGTPFIYQGQEIGMRNAHFKSLDEIEDVEAHNMDKIFDSFPIIGKRARKVLFDVSRDNARTPMCWNDSEFGGFSKVKPWLRVNPSKDEVNVKKALLDKDSLFYFYQSLIKIRKEHKVVVDGDFKMLDINNPHIFEYVRENDDEKMVVVSNFSDKERTFKTRKEVWNSSLLLSNYDGFSELLRPYETRIYLIKKK